MLARIVHTYVSWLSGFFGWFAVYLGVSVYIGVDTVLSGTGMPPADTHATLALYTLAAAGLARVAVSATLHAIGTLFAPREQRGNRWLHGLGIASASPVMGLTIVCAPLTIGFSDLAPDGSVWMLLGIVLVTWLVGLVLGSSITGLMGVVQNLLELPATPAPTRDDARTERATGFLGQVQPA